MTGAAAPRPARRLRADRSGVAMLEFAFSLPLVLMAGMYGVETANLALVNLRISQIALNLADDAARVGNTPGNTQQLREVDINDVFQAARYQGNGIQLTTRGRITISSLENVARTYQDGTSDPAPVQRLHWQRCIGQMSGPGYDSSYGSATPLATAGTDTTQTNAGVISTGMGDPGSTVAAPIGSGVIFVEIDYNYKPLLPGYMPGITRTSRIHYVASFIVRDNRDYSRVFNPATSVTPSSCDLYTTNVGGSNT